MGTEPSRVSRRQAMAAMAASGAALLAGCGRLPFQLPGEARRPARIPRLGILSRSPDSPYEPGLIDGLRELGYVEGQNVHIDRRYVQPDIAGEATDELNALAAELVALPVDAIATIGILATFDAKRATSMIPIVQVRGVGELVPVLAESYARPGGNVTGMTSMVRELVGKWLQLLKEAAPAV